MNLTQAAVDAATPRTKPYTLREGDLRLVVHPDGSKIYHVAVESRGRHADIEIGPHRVEFRSLADLPPGGLNLSASHTLVDAQRLAELSKLLYWPAVDTYVAHHGSNERADAFAHEVVERSTVCDAIREVMDGRMTDAQREQYRKDLAATTTTSRKLRNLLDRTDIACKFHMHDDRTIGYPEILEFLQRQVSAAGQALRKNKGTGSTRHDIEHAAGNLAVACDLFDVPRTYVLPLLKLMLSGDKVSDRTLTKYMQPLLK